MDSEQLPHDTIRPRLTDTLLGFRLGAMVNLSNPKGIAFFIGLYAVAVPPDTALWAKAFILVASFAIEFIWYSILIVVLTTGRARYIYARFGVTIDRTIGAVLILLGVRLVAEKK